jgi:ABC-type molybdate transport system permease subunit
MDTAGISEITAGIPKINALNHLAFGLCVLIIVVLIRFRSLKYLLFKDFGFFELFSTTLTSLRSTGRYQKSIIAVVLLLIAGYIYFAIRAVSVPINEYDVLAYHVPLATDIFNRQSFIPYPEKYWHFYFPSNFELWLSCWLFTGRSLLTAIFQIPFLIPVMLLSYSLVRSLGHKSEIAWFSALILAGTPILMFQSTTLMNELFSLPFLIAAILFSVRFLNEEKLSDAFYAGCGLGLAIGAKYSFLTLVISIPLAIVLGLWLKNRNSHVFKTALKFSAFYLLPGILIPSVWFIRNWILRGNPLYPFEIELFGMKIYPGIPSVFDPNYDINFVPNKLLWLVYPWIERGYSPVQGWGLVAGWIGVPGLIVYTLHEFSDKSRRHFAGFVGLFFLLSIAFWWKLTQHEPRFLIFLLPLFACYAALTLLNSKRMVKIGAYILIGLFLITFSIATLAQKVKTDIRLREYNNGFLNFYGLPAECDNWDEDATILLFADCTYGHLLSYPLSGKSMKRRVFTIGLSEISDETELQSLYDQHKDIIPENFDYVVYYLPDSKMRIDLTKILNLEPVSTSTFTASDSRYLLKLGRFELHKNFEFILNRDHQVRLYKRSSDD